MRAAFDFAPGAAERGRVGIALEGLPDFGDDGALGQWFGLGIDLRPPDDPDLGRCIRQGATVRQCRFQAEHGKGPLRSQGLCGGGIACQHQIWPTRQGPKTRRQGAPGGAPHDHGAALGALPEMSEVLGQVPRHGVVVADHAVGGPGINQIDAHGWEHNPLARHNAAMNHSMQAFLKAVGTPWPVVQAPMAGSQGSALALAVCAAGGVGSLAAATLSADALQQELSVLAKQAQGPWNVNFFCHNPPPDDPVREKAWLDALRPLADRLGVSLPAGRAVASRSPFSRELLDLIRPYRPPVVSFHFGLPRPELVGAIKAWGGQVWSSATTVDEARWLEQRGVDVVIAQGLEAGGHRGMFLTTDVTTQTSLLALLPQVVRAVRIPVLAAGGIAHEAGVQAALALGAAGVQVGTAYLLCPEAQTHPLHRAALASDRARHTALTNVFTGRPARGIVNRAMRELGDGATCLSARAPAFPLAGWAMAGLRSAAEAAGLDDCSPLWAGQAAPLCEPATAAELTQRLGRAAHAATPSNA